MRTLKKSLCLVLAVVMILGLGAFNVSALTTKDYADANQIKYGEAIDILGAIGVLEGDDDDNDGNIDFRPDATLTRAEAAKIITALLGVTAVSATMPFSDVPLDHWALNNIAYCAEQKIIEGTDDEAQTFEPEAQLTGGQFAKMLLVALGYDPNNAYAVLNGDTWLIGVSKLVHENNLARGIDDFASKYEEPITRQDAAQMAFNTLCAPLVTYDNRGGSWEVNGVVVTREASDPKYMTTSVRDTQTISSALINDGSATGTYIVEFAEKYQPKLRRVTTDEDDFGRPATTWTYNREDINTYVNTSLRVASWNDEIENKDAYKAIGGDLINRLGNNTSGEYVAFRVIENGVEVASTDAYNNYLAKWRTNNGDKDTGAAGQITEIYIDDDVYYGTNLSTRFTQITVIVIDTYLASISSVMNSKGEAKVTVVEEDTEEFGGVVVTVKQSDVPNIGDFKEDEKILVQQTQPGTKDRSVKVVMPCEVLTDVYVNAYTSDKGKMDSVTYSGNKYSVAHKAHWNKEILVDYSKRELKGFTYDIFKDQFGNLIGIDFNQTDTDYVFVTAITTSSSGYLSGGSYSAGLIFTDGTKSTKTVKLSDNSNTTAKSYFTEVRKGGLNDGDHDGLVDCDAADAEDLVNGAGRSWKTVRDDGAVINRWFTYSKSDDGSITLRNCVGYPSDGLDGDDFSTGSTMQWAGYEEPAGRNKIDISSSEPALEIGVDAANGYAFGNDKTVYLSATVAADPVEGGSITKINNITTGIKNTNIALLDVQAESQSIYDDSEGKDPRESLNNFAMYLEGDKTGDEKWANVYFIYDNDTHYIEYAICISSKAAKDVVFITSSGVTKSEYIEKVGYVDSYDAIYHGQKITIQVDREKSETDDTKMKGGNMYRVTFDAATGRVVEVDTDALPDADDYDEDENPINDTDTNRSRGYAIDTAVQNFQVKGNTLYTDDSLKSYILLDSSTKFFVAEAGAGGADDYDEYRTSASAVSAAEDKGEITAVYAECSKTTGFATSVILITNGDGGSVNSDGIVILTEEDLPTIIAPGYLVVLYTGNVPTNRALTAALQEKLGTGVEITKVETNDNGETVFTYREVGKSITYTYTVVGVEQVKITSGTVSDLATGTPVVVDAGTTLTIKGDCYIGELYVLGTVVIDDESTLSGDELYIANGGKISGVSFDDEDAKIAYESVYGAIWVITYFDADAEITKISNSSFTDENDVIYIITNDTATISIKNNEDEAVTYIVNGTSGKIKASGKADIRVNKKTSEWIISAFIPV